MYCGHDGEVEVLQTIAFGLTAADSHG